MKLYPEGEAVARFKIRGVLFTETCRFADSHK